MTLQPLPLPDDPILTAILNDWPSGYVQWAFPQSAWLRQFEDVLRRHYPQASSDELTLTARLAAPFPLAKPGVP